ncbi:hypothetical protein WME97_12845 [Sorangium sp. So ce367]|uniref:hypothetical protein n=1 Tax=Sorangium sp. So ce367 TaxID=3133305 RepID=UPI003F61F340
MKLIVVRSDAKEDPELSGDARLVALFHWLRGEGSPQLVITNPATGQRMTDPLEAEWGRFPLQVSVLAKFEGVPSTKIEGRAASWPSRPWA